MKRVLMTTMILLTACAKDRNIEATITGVDGKNGHSITSVYNKATELECESGGQRLDMYLDLDDSLDVSESDKYVNSLVSCNGANGKNGLDGKQGEQGPQGLQGLVGPKGDTGATGATGLQGPVGPQGPTGPQGLQGASGSSAAIKVYTSECKKVTEASSNIYVKQNGSNFALYTSSSCSSSSKFKEINDGESYFVSDRSLAINQDGTALRIITFN